MTTRSIRHDALLSRARSTTVTVAVVGLGYVGTALATLLSRSTPVVAVDIDERRVTEVNAHRSPIVDAEASAAMATGLLDLTATLDAASAYQRADVVFIATPTNYDPESGAFDTSSVEAVIDDIAATNPGAIVVIKSTIPVGFTRRMRAEHPMLSILFSPEFLREGRALYDSLHPSRVIVSDPGPDAELVAGLLADAAEDDDVPVLIMGAEEAEAVKLFANTYLALRVAYFNELDTFAARSGLDARAIVEGVGLDPRIGTHYNNPGFGYGGYCLPKDTRQLLATFGDVPQNLIAAIVLSNSTRMDVIANDILDRCSGTIGVHRIAMKAGSDNARSSATLGVVARLVAAGADFVVYEPGRPPVPGARVTDDLDEFLAASELIVANRWAPELAAVADRVYSRDLYGRD